MSKVSAVAMNVLAGLAGVLILQACDKASPGATTEEVAPQPTASSGALQEAVAKPQAASEKASPARVRFGTAGCDACLATQCNPYRESVPFLAQCVDSTCEETFACFQRNRCTTDAETVNQCYCGPVSNEKCLTENFVAKGPCAKRLHDAFGTSNTRDVFGMMFGENTSTGDGAALFRCAAELCLAECVKDSAIPPYTP